jgi:predicted protein tyrosine phosphatase
MKLVVCALGDVATQVRRHRPAGVVSLLSPDLPTPALPGDPPRLVLRFNDIDAPREGLLAPDAAMIESLLAFAEGFPDDATLLIHCWMGISRSPAAAFILACARSPAVAELEIALALRKAASSATPNLLMARLADDLLGRGGRIARAVAHIGRGRESGRGSPFELDTARLQRRWRTPP